VQIVAGVLERVLKPTLPFPRPVVGIVSTKSEVLQAQVYEILSRQLARSVTFADTIRQAWIPL